MPLTWTDPLVRHKQWKGDKRFGTWNVSSIYRSGSLATVTRVVVRYKLDFVGVREVRWDKRGMVIVGELYFFLWKRKRKSSIGNWIFFVHHRIISVVKRVEFISGRMSCIVLRGRWCNIIVLNVHALSEEKIDCKKDSFYE